MQENGIRTIDAIIVIIYMLAMAIISWFAARRQKSKESYLMASRNMHWFPLALSSVAAAFSAISLLGAPGFVIANDMRYFPTLFTGLISIPIVFFIVLPYLYKLKMVSIYEYLETRFSPLLRLLATIMFMLTKLGYLAMVIFTPALILAAVTGIDIKVLIVIFGIITTIYTTAGGLEGVVWTQIVQYFAILFSVAGILLFFIFSGNGHTVSEYWQLAANAGKTRMLDFSFGIGELTIWVLILNSTLMGIANICNDQANVQRFFAAKSVGHAMKGYLFSMIFGTPIVASLFILGAWTYGFFQVGHYIPEKYIAKPDMIFPYFIASYIPAGLSGLILSGIFAAGMSTISAVQHSLASTFMVDIYEKFFYKEKNEKKYVLISRIVSFCWGLAAVILAFFVMKLGDTILEVTVILASFLAAPLGGIYFLGMFTKKANNAGALSGGLFGVLVTSGSYLLNKFDIVKINFMWFAVFGLIATFVTGYLISCLKKGLPNEQIGIDYRPEEQSIQNN